MSPWWSEMTATWIGAVGGSAAGVLGGIYGALCGVLASRGRAKGFVLGFHALLLGGGVLGLGGGIVGIVVGQPPYVYVPLLLVGVVLTGVMGPLLPVVRGAYAQADKRRLEAEGIRRGQPAG